LTLEPPGKTGIEVELVVRNVLALKLTHHASLRAAPFQRAGLASSGAPIMK
jgi:hypothetical protein